MEMEVDWIGGACVKTIILKCKSAEVTLSLVLVYTIGLIVTV